MTNETTIPGSAIYDSSLKDMRTTSSLEKDYLPERIKGQIFDLIDHLEVYNSQQSPENQRSTEDYAYLRHFFPAFVADRNKRAAEVNNPEYKKAVEIAEEELPMTTLSLMCVDGRVKMIHVFGFSAEIGSAIREPAGFLKDFVRNKEGKLRLKPKSSFSELLDDAIDKHQGLAEVFDAHYSCARKKIEENGEGKFPEDDGLFRDVLLKREMVDATRKYILDQHGDSKDIALIQTSFNPITAYMYVGLDTDLALDFAREFARKKAADEGRNPEKAMPQYSKAVLKALIEEGLIISTGNLIKNEAIMGAFDKNYFDVDWKDNYIKSAKSFWTGIAAMKAELMPLLRRNITSIYPELSSDDKSTRRELDERAMLLLANAFNAYLHNRDHDEMEYLDLTDEEYEKEGHYEYDQHKEECIKISRGGHPIYKIPAFVINIEDVENMPSHLEFVGGIVRSNRIKGNVKDSHGFFDDNESFVAAPIPVIAQEIVTDSRVTNEEWKALEEIDWTGIESMDWDTMSHDQFAEIVNKRGKLTGPIRDAIEDLRQIMAKVYEPNSLTSAHLIDQHQVILPIVCGPDRKTHTVIPFVKLGI